MKKLYTLLSLLIVQFASAQIINFPDPSFKSALLYASEAHPMVTNLAGEYFAPDANGDNEIDVQEAANVRSFYFFMFGGEIVDYTGIEYFVNLEEINCSFGLAETINFSTLTHFKYLIAEGCNLTSLDFSNCPDLRNVYCPNNQLTELNLSGATMIESIDVSGNQLTSLEVHAHSTAGIMGGLELLCYDNQLTSLTVEGHFNTIECQNNLLTDLDLSHCIGGVIGYFFGNPVQTMNLKNGGYDNAIGGWPIPAPAYICADEGYEIEEIQLSYFNEGITTGYEINSFCSIPPGGEYFTVQGTTHIDTNGNGCELSDPVYGHLNLEVTNQFSQQTVHHANGSGNYALWLPQGNYTIVPQIVNPAYFNIIPPILTVDLESQTEPIVQDFCIMPNGDHPDMSVTLLPLEQARPGFDVDYKIIYKNVGSTTISGSVALSYDDAVIDPVSANPSVGTQLPGSMAWTFSDLEPFESRDIILTLNLNAPTETPPLNDGDILNFTATGTVAGDENTTDNTSLLAQTIVNSLDPNDKTCLQGDSISPDMAGEYVHYMIRFENTGTADAVNIFVKDVIDTDKFDLESLVSLEGSHPYVTRIIGNKAEFIFENINLPFDDANNDGYVLFKIKTKPTLVLGDTFSNTANIYFDYNHPIVTNTATTILSLLNVNDFEFDSMFTVYPNPTSDVLNIQSKTNTAIQSLQIYNVLGQLMVSVANPQHNKSIDVSMLKTGNYFLKITSDKGTSTTKFIKK